MKHEMLIHQITTKQSLLCVGLDPQQEKLPLHLRESKDGIIQFCKEIIDVTHDLAIAYKPNIAFFECLGSKGWEMLEEITAHIPDNIFTIADAKRGDIGNTSKMYAKCFFETMNFDAVTVAPYMGKDSVTPFLEFEDKWVILLGLTSNAGSQDFQHLHVNGRRLYEEVILKAMEWADHTSLMFVVGATHGEKMKALRELSPMHFFLVPGIGAQGGDMDIVLTNGINEDGGLLINAARSILYAGSGEDYTTHARAEAVSMVKAMRDSIPRL